MKDVLKRIGLFLVLKVTEILFVIGVFVTFFGWLVLIVLGGILLSEKLTSLIDIIGLIKFIGYSIAGIFGFMLMGMWISDNCEKVSNIMKGHSTLREEINSVSK